VIDVTVDVVEDLRVYVGEELQVDVVEDSDSQGFAKPQGYAGKGVVGKGQGRDN